MFGFHLDGGLVGLDLEQHIALGDLVAFGAVPCCDAAFFHVLVETRHRDLIGHA